MNQMGAAALTGLAAGVVAYVLTRFVTDTAQQFLNKNGKKK